MDGSLRRWAAFAAFAVGAIYVLRLDHVAGLIKDDAWYMVLAKALASGQGFALISSATTPILPTVPPGFPALLAPVFWIHPSFPDNVIWLKLISVAALGIAAVVVFLDYRAHRGVEAPVALVLTTVVMLTPALVFLATSTVMSDCVFLSVQVLAVVALEQAARGGGRGWPVIAGALSAAAYLVRITGLAVIAAGAAYLIVRRQRRSAMVFLAVAAVGILPWELYARAHAPTMAQRIEHGGSIAFPYRQLVTTGADRAVAISAGEQWSRGLQNLNGIFTRDIGAAIVPILYRGANESGQEVVSVGEPGRGSMGGAFGTRVVSLVLWGLVGIGIFRSRAWLSLPVLLLGATVLMVAPVNAQTFRYLVPVVPFLVVYLWHGVRLAHAGRIVMATLLSLHLLDHAGYLQLRWTGGAEWLAEGQDVDQVLAFIAGSDEGAVASTNPGLVYLRTGRKGIYLVNPDRNWDTWRSWNVRYVAALQPLPKPAHAAGLSGGLRTARFGYWAVQIP